MSQRSDELYQKILELRAKRKGVSREEAEKVERSKPFFLLAAEVCAKRLGAGVSPKEVLEADLQWMETCIYPTPECLTPDEIEDLIDAGVRASSFGVQTSSGSVSSAFETVGLPEARLAHLESCNACCTLLAASRPKQERREVIERFLAARSSVEKAAKVSRTIDYLLFFVLLFVFLGGYHTHFMLTAGDWDFWVDWKDGRQWVTVTPIMAITFCAAVQYMLWEKFCLPVGATLVILGLLFGELVNRYFNFWEWTYFPVNFVWPPSLVPSAIALDVVLLLSRSYLLTALIGGLAFALLMYPTNWPHLAPFHVPVEYHGSVMSVAEVIGYQYMWPGQPEHIRMVEKDTLRTFGRDVTPVVAFFSGFVCVLIYFWWHYVVRWLFLTPKIFQRSQ
jgi:methane/ammonia monooxygenase subunit A